MRLPSWLAEKLSTPPTAGDGIHAWLFSTARQLHVHMSAAEMFDTLVAATAGCDRRVTHREIRDAVNNSAAVAWQKPGSESTCKQPLQVGVEPPAPQKRWIDPAAREVAILAGGAAGVPSVVDLWENSPAKVEWTADDWIDWLFPGAEWICLAEKHPADALTRPPASWYFGAADRCGLVVPSPMTGPSGREKGGDRSHRCLDNTGPRRWLVIEFDNGTLDEQAAIHWHLRSIAPGCGWPPLRLCVHSAGKSVHGWYGPVESEEQAQELMEYAVLLGADPATWNRCQLIRLPGGRRKTRRGAANLPDGWEEPGEFTSLEVLYFDR